MKRLNPIYLLALVVTIYLISLNYLSEKKDEFKSVNDEYKSFNLKAESFKKYNESWFNKKRVEKRLDLILKNSQFRKEKILTTKTKNSYRFKIESANQRILNKFLNRILNEKLLLKKLDIQKNSISAEVEIK